MEYYFKLKSLKNEIIIALAGIVSYAVCLINDFHNDDWLVLHNYSDGFSWDEILSMENLGRFRPLTNILLFFRYLAFGDHAAPYYALNIVLHVAVCIFFYRLLLKIGLRRAMALAAGLIFAVYFQHYEAVIWLYGTIRIFAAAFWIGSLWALHNYIRDGRGRTLAIFAIISALGLLVVEDFAVAPLGFVIFVVIFTERGLIWKRLWPVAAIGIAGLALYFILRSALIMRPQIVEEYYYFGPHIFSRLGEYFGWLALPPPDHPYFQMLSSHLGPIAYKIWAGLSFALMLGLMGYTAFLIFKVPHAVRFFALFIFLTLLPALPLSYKVTSRNLYLPSLGFAVVLAHLFSRILEQTKEHVLMRRLVYAVAVAFLILSILSIGVTSLEYRKNQTSVAGMISDIRASRADLSKCKYVLLDHMPGRAIVGPAMIYRFGYIENVVASNDPIHGPIDIPKAVQEIARLGEPFVVFDYRNGHLVEATIEYRQINEAGGIDFRANEVR